MAGPNSAPNGDTSIVLGHVNEKFVCGKHGDKELDACERSEKCVMISLRTYLAERNRLVTGKTHTR